MNDLPRVPGESALPKLACFARRDEFAGDMEEAIGLFWSSHIRDLRRAFGRDQVIELLVSPLVVTNFHNYFTLDYENRSGETLAELFLERKTHSLSAIERLFMDDVRRSYVAPFSVAKADGNSGHLALQNLWFADEELTARRSEFVAAPREGDLFCLRIADLSSGARVRVGDLYPFPGGFQSRLLGALEDYRDELGAIGRSLPARRLLKGATTHINHSCLKANGVLRDHPSSVSSALSSKPKAIGHSIL